jgi:hypothetical protein
MQQTCSSSRYRRLRQPAARALKCPCDNVEASCLYSLDIRRRYNGLVVRRQSEEVGERRRDDVGALCFDTGQACDGGRVICGCLVGCLVGFVEIDDLLAKVVILS